LATRDGQIRRTGKGESGLCRGGGAASFRRGEKKKEKKKSSRPIDSPKIGLKNRSHASTYGKGRGTITVRPEGGASTFSFETRLRLSFVKKSRKSAEVKKEEKGRTGIVRRDGRKESWSYNCLFRQGNGKR